MKIMIKASIAVLCAISLFGCSSMRSEYQQPELDIPQGWSQTSLPSAVQNSSDNAVALAQPEQWWTLFNDPALNRLIDKVLVSNSDIEKATLTLRKALLEAGVSENNKVPKLGFSQSSSYEYDFDSGSSDSSYSTGLSLSYELDLWNRVAALADASELAARASYEDRENIAQDLVVTTATLYWKVAYLHQRLALIKDNIMDSERIAKLTKLKYKNGSNTSLEVIESEQALFNQQVQLSQLQQELSEAKNSLSILLNQPLQETGISLEQLSVQPIPDIEAGIPAQLLLRRPDVRASLYELRSTLASKDAVAAGYLPTITLTGALNSSSSSLLNLLKNPVATLGSGIVLPFLEWREMELNKGISEIDYQMAVVNYRDTLYQAFEEVDNLLTAKKHYDYQAGVYQEQYTNAKEIERIYESKYTYGESEIIDWLNAMESRRSIESSLLESRYNQFVVQAMLYQSLGGGDIVGPVVAQ
ncbi:efflux transporter outer membrane subunit [Neptuniibacter sp. 1_MG-2023]|uniref:efflux transporter outer membrane subunit n=1 Tax=Neptuniibacter sp. 1_MG-2023 TaxID=3062662 RepID=UPI0026E22FCE|nr:TolC family protein [Neptuniibacter sp. 1_MG-2023]MDO6592860.1 TolC family protein [Neptuniibacter sp. 1_MG-2023]